MTGPGASWGLGLAMGLEKGADDITKSGGVIFEGKRHKLVAVNEELEKKAKLINEDCYGKGWLFKIKPDHLDELKNLMTNAETKAEHARLAQHFEAEAARYEAESKEHADLAQFYQQHTSAEPTKYPGTQQSFQHCDALSKSLQQAAENARALASEQRRMEKEAKK